jgi:hypothetical protein
VWLQFKSHGFIFMLAVHASWLVGLMLCEIASCE